MSKNYRLSKGTTEHYESLDEMRLAWGLKPAANKTSNQERLKKQQDQFLGTCKICGEQMKFVMGTNVVVCDNPQCKGIVVTDRKGDEPKILPVSRILNEKGMAIGNSIFA